jgi:hypothetical protein
MQKQTKQNEQTMRFAQIDSQLFSFEPYQDTDAKASQKHGFIRYDGKIVYFQTPELVLRTGGIPKFNDQYHKKEEDRGFIKIPLDENHMGGKLLLEKCRELDEYFLGKQESLFGKKTNEYQYQSLIRLPQVDEDEDEKPKEAKVSKYPPLPKLPFLKVKMDFDYGTKALKTKLSLVNEQGEASDAVVEHIDDIAQHLRLNSEFRAVLSFSKHWAQKKGITQQSKKLWGVTLKVRRVRIKSRTQVQKTGPQDDFIDSDSEENELKQFKRSGKEEIAQERVSVEETEQLETGEGEEEELEENLEQLEEEEDLEIPEPRKPEVKKMESMKTRGKATSKPKATAKKTTKLEV